MLGFLELTMKYILGGTNLILAFTLLGVFILTIFILGKLSDKFEKNYIKEEKQGKFHDKALFIIVFIALGIYLFLGGIFSDFIHSLI